MTSKERVYAAIQHREPDRVPVGEAYVDYPVIEHVLGRETFYRSHAREVLAHWDGRRDEVVDGQKRDIVEFVRRTGLDILPVAEAYFSLALRLELPWVLERIRQLPRATHWQQQARAALRDELFAEQRALTGELFQNHAKASSTEERVTGWFDLNAGQVAHYRQVLADLQTAKDHDLAMLSVAVKEVRNLARSGQIMAA